MFTKNNKSSDTPTPIEQTKVAPAQDAIRGASSKPAARAASIICADMKINGSVTSEGALQIDGTVDGDVSATDITIGASGHITGEVKAEVVRVKGRIKGSIRARKVELETGATEIADLFLSAGKPIVETKGENSPLKTYYATEKSSLIDVDLVLLINIETASASEILAGAIQDNDRGLIIGRRSFGKGLVQDDKQLNDGSNLRLTIARYYTPTGRCIQKPYSGDYDSYNQDVINRYENGEMYLIDSSQFIDSLKFITPKGRVVYGGGGIMPDIFVPYETLGVSSFYSELRSLNAFRTFVFDYVKDKRNKWSSPQQFNEEFNVTSSLLNTFLNFTELNYKLEKQIKKNQASRDLIAQRMKAEIASQIWGEQGFYQVINTENEDIKEAIKAFN